MLITPLADAEAESSETVTLTLLSGTGYTLGAATTATLEPRGFHRPANPPRNPPPVSSPRPPSAPHQQELARVMNLGYSAWIDDQFLRAPNLHLPIVQTWQTELQTSTFTNSALVSSEHRMEAWWRQSMRSDAASDPLRQRMAFALSQIFVISDRMDSLNNDQRGDDELL